MDAYDGGIACFVSVEMFWPLWCRIVMYGVWWNGGNCVHILKSYCMQGGGVFVVENDYDCSIVVYFGCHSHLVYGFFGGVKLPGGASTIPLHFVDLVRPDEPKIMSQLCEKLYYVSWCSVWCLL